MSPTPDAQHKTSIKPENTAKPSISVIVVTYASEDTVRACLESILNSAKHSGAKVEVIVVDNASPDGTVATVREHFPMVRLIAYHENLGYAKAINVGLKESRGDYVLILNPDCILSSDAIHQLVSFAESNNRIGIIGPMLLNRDGTLQPSGRRAQKLIHIVLSLIGLHSAVEAFLLGKGRDYKAASDVEEVSGAAMFCRRKALAEAGGMDERFFLYFEDVDLCARVRRLGWRISYCPYAKVMHLHRSSTSKVGELARRSFYASACIYLRKHCGSAVIPFKLLAIVRESIIAILKLLTHPLADCKERLRTLVHIIRS
ncbi:MAG: glycosyltransferase family 2 protein [Armatimonadota bacterium]|nr:glycosyltransferase family 2 protein [Armatimonadota bacterium]MCX7776532.1 glycosyltransferase family 2 protein [Armatimonadota bacterium]MDW8024331.1 glycosyltransferase family 2 protein [Armatimonadota bacterium]